MRIGFIGLGMMGHHMVANLQNAGHELVVYDIRREAGANALSRGARWAETPADAARQSEIVMTSLPGPKEVEAVVLGENGIIHGAAPGTIYIDLSTSSPTLIRRIAQVLKDKNIRVADAPVSGGVVGAEEATLQIMVGCDAALYDQITPALRGIGDKITHCGEVGAGEIAKLVHNQIALVVQQVVAEGLTLGTKAGIQPEKLLEAIRGGAYGRGGGGIGPGLERTALQGKWDEPRFALALARKDVGLAIDLAAEFSVPMPVAAAAEQAMIEAMNKGWGGKDMTAMFGLQEEKANVQVRVTPPSAVQK
jgi:3-hydroxyisobutyrate dehydrogenase